jgi:hypothetical protein
MDDCPNIEEISDFDWESYMKQANRNNNKDDIYLSDL